MRCSCGCGRKLRLRDHRANARARTARKLVAEMEALCFGAPAEKVIEKVVETARPVVDMTRSEELAQRISQVVSGHDG